MTDTADTVIRARNLGKAFRLYESPWHRLVEALAGRPRHAEHHALRDISFEVERGSGFGVIGQNGAGKSTLLKILAGVLTPSSGSVDVRGKISSILELGAGFHPEFTGRQNIRLNAAMIGLDAREVDQRTPAIIEFCELGGFLDQPVKVYSTGMSMRLAFAIATQVDPDVLIVDEALSVGDGYFQKKCSDRILELVQGGTTLLFCSHAMYFVDAFCERVLWLRDGQVAALGKTKDVIDRYEAALQGASAVESASPSIEEAPVVVGSPARMTQILVQGSTDTVELASGDTLQIEVAWETEDPSLQFQLGVGVNRADGLEVFTLRTTEEDSRLLCGKGRYRVTLEVPSLPLLKGSFDLYFFLLDREALHVYDRKIRHRVLRIESDHYQFGVVRIDHRFHLESDEAPQLSVGASRCVGASR